MVHIYSLNVTANVGFADLTSATSYWYRTNSQTQDASESISSTIGYSPYIPIPFADNPFVIEFTNIAISGSAGTGDFAISGSVVIDILDMRTRAWIADNVQINATGAIPGGSSAEVKATEQMKATKVQGHDSDTEPLTPVMEVKCPVTGAVSTRPRVATDPVVWTQEAWQRLQLVPLIARPLARNTVERFARNHEIWRVTTPVMDDNKQAMIEADEFDIDTMMVMFTELRAKQIRAEAEGKDALSPEMRAFIEEAKAQGITRCPIRDIEAKMDKCPVDMKTVTPEEAKRAVEKLLQ